MTSFRILAVFAAGYAAVAPAFAAPDRSSCEVEIQELGEAKINRYNALDGGDYLEPIRLRIRNKGDELCAGVVKISRITGSPELTGPHGGKLTYTIVAQNDLGNVVYDPKTNNGNLIPVSIPGRSTIEISPRLFVSGSQPGRAGRYAATLEAGFIPAGNNAMADAARFNVSAQVTPSVQANFIGSTNPRHARLDLGELVPNKQGSISLQIRASSDYQISFQSENKGVLEGPADSSIPYSMTYAGRLIDLSRTDEQQFNPADPVRPQTNLINVVVGQFNSARAGTYSDQVTITISAL
ncbi:hypothetical protein [Sphingopyxis granuli]|uniref:Spore coat protein U domain-containing protein n=1 Tax=Sphingopyxis granuli TaxID=267128 RepID=A0AA86GKF3_9SPHN|nr:hypothetical protein [Sphingopyxis granuli]AMG73826.1 Uncharacterized protein SGRAN_1437 [Sphingopyxis granuli]